MNSRSDCSYRELPRTKELLPSRIVKLASTMFARDTGLSGPQIFEFFSKFSDEIGKMRYGSGVPSRWQMFENFLESLPVEQQRKALLELCDFQLRNAPTPTVLPRLRPPVEDVPPRIAEGFRVRLFAAVTNIVYR
jgi:hypothetical protein